MKTIIQSIKINSVQLLTGKYEAINNSISSFFSDRDIESKHIAKIDLFIDIKNEEDYTSAESNLKELLAILFYKRIPAYSIITNTYVADTKAEATLIFTICSDNNIKIEHKEFQKLSYTLCTSAQNRILFSGNIKFNENNDLMRSTQLAFDFAEQLLDHEEMHFGHVNYMNAQIDKNFISQTIGQQSSWDTINQIKELYFDPSLLVQGFPPLSLNSINTRGIQLSFTASQKDTFPTHQVSVYENKIGLQLHASASKELQQTSFYASYNKEFELSQNQNIITQTNECINFISDVIKKMEDETDSKITMNLAIVHLKDSTDLPDAELIIKQQLKASEYLFVESDLQHPEALIAIEGALCF